MSEQPKPALVWQLNDPRPENISVPPRWNASPRQGVTLTVEQRDSRRWAWWLSVLQPHGWSNSEPKELAGDAVDAQLACEAAAAAAGLFPLPSEHGWRLSALRALLSGLSDSERRALIAEALRDGTQ